MRTSGTISIGTINDVEQGDLIAYEFLGKISWGTVIAPRFCRSDLTSIELQYMYEQGLDVPDGDFEMLTAPGERLIFWRNGDKMSHFYSAGDRMVAFFPYREK